MSKDVSILIPSWNGRHLLEKYLATNLLLFQQELEHFEVIVIDNGSSDSTVAWLKEEFAKEPVTVIALPCNFGFGYALNQGITQARFPYIYLLNNDLLITAGSLKPLFLPFSEKDVFATYPWQTIIKEGRQKTYAGGLLKFSYGMFRQGEQFGGDFSPQETARPSWYTSGAAALFSTEKLRQLGGFNLLYSPAYYEDTDLSHRAWQRGWRVLSVPTPPVMHYHESTASKLPHWKLQMIQKRNLFLFHWCLLQGASFWWQHLIWLPVNIIRESRDAWITPLAFSWALFYLPRTIAFRAKQRPSISDARLLQLLSAETE